MLKIDCTVKGTAPLLMNRFDDAAHPENESIEKGRSAESPHLCPYCGCIKGKAQGMPRGEREAI